MRIPTGLSAILLLAFFLTASLVNPFTLHAEDSNFRIKFTQNYKDNNFKKQEKLVKKHQYRIVAEVELLVFEAREARENGNRERMFFLLDLASAMASTHMYINNGPADTVEYVRKVLNEEVTKDKAKKALKKKYKKAERAPGNFVMEKYSDRMETRGVNPVIFPHWIHRSFFRCKVCHEDIFKMKRGANLINHKQFDEGLMCGKCHNGKVSFETDRTGNCGRCHSFNTPSATSIINLSYYDKTRFEEVAKRLGSKWEHGLLTEELLPLDKFKFINWVELEKLGAFTPLISLEKGVIEAQKSELTAISEIRDNLILFESTSSFLKDTIFSHKIHSTWIKCTLCHDALFKQELGATNVTMLEMKDGKACGTCHGRVSFTYKDCKRCHAVDRDNIPPDVLIRPKPKKKAVKGK